MSLNLKNISKSFNEKQIYNNFCMQIAEGTISCILGPSGCGKTTLLNIIGGILAPDSGTLEGFENKKFSYIFQEPRLLPWKTVRENIEFVLDNTKNGEKVSAQQRKNEADALIKKVELEEFANYYPSQLSGGMKQRVSIARAFAATSNIILMDEPLNGLDINLKQGMLRWFSQLWQQDKRTVIFVTHDIDDALMLGSDIYLLSKAPVQITMHQQITEPIHERNMESPEIAAIRKRMTIIFNTK
jgi:NitT/TauT family transport system ATP-binding protein